MWRRVSDPPARVEDPGPHLPATLMREFPVRSDPNPVSDFCPSYVFVEARVLVEAGL